MAVNPLLTKGSTVEVSSDDVGFQGAWYVATLMDVIEPSPTKKQTSNKQSRSRKKSGYMVKYDTLFKDDDMKEQLTELVDFAFVRPLPPSNPRRNNSNEAEAEAVAEAVAEAEEGFGEFEVNDVVDAYHRDGWWIGVVNKVINNGETKKFVVSFDSPPEEVEFERSQLRLHVDWIDGRWKVPPKKTPSVGALTGGRHSNGDVDSVGKKWIAKRFQSSAGVENIEAMVSAINEDGSPISTEALETEDGKSQPKRKRGRPRKSLIKRPDGLLEGNQEATDESHEITTGLDKLPISAWYQGLHPLSVLKRSSCSSTLDHHDTAIGALNPAIVENTVCQQELPFVKQSPLWATIESLELYQKPPQKPHFSPLKDLKEDYREGSAIAQMVTFANVVQSTSKLQWTDPNNLLENNLEALLDLETHGFDVGVVRARLKELLSIKALVSQLEEELKGTENEIENRNREKTLIDNEVNKVKLKMQELQEKLTENRMMKNLKDEEITMLQANSQVFSKQMEDQKVAFDLLLASPL